MVGVVEATCELPYGAFAVYGVILRKAFAVHFSFLADQIVANK